MGSKDRRWRFSPRTILLPGLASVSVLQAAGGAAYHPTVWNSPADLAAYDDALQASAQQIENSFRGVLAD